jgi:hypothetical protein
MRSTQHSPPLNINLNQPPTMNTPEIIKELFTEWVNENQDRIRFAAWVKTLTPEQISEFKSKLTPNETQPTNK